MAPSQVVYSLPLKNDGSPDVPGSYINLPPPSDPPYTLRFVVEGSSPICRHGSLWVNIPAPGESFHRDTFRQYILTAEFNRSIEIDIPITCAGAFAFYVTFAPLPEFSTATSPKPVLSRSPTHFVDVCPAITLNGQSIPLNSLSIFSVISKFMGNYPADWDKHLRGIGQRGYNMVHFTPLMRRGASNSPYSIYDQLAFDQETFPDGEKDVGDMIGRMEKEHGLLALTDVVWNHTANNSKWLEEHPEAGYSVQTAPWLEAALELDDALLKYSQDLDRLGLPTEFHAVDDLLEVMNGMRTHVIDKIKLWEFYPLDVKRDTAATIEAWAAGNVRIPDGGFGDVGIGGLGQIKAWTLKQKATFLREKAVSNISIVLGRFARQIHPPVAAAVLTAIYGRYENVPETDRSSIEDTLSKVLDEVNLPLFQEFDKDVLEIFDQIFNRVKYLRIDDHGPKLGPVSKENPLIETYFTRLPLNETTRKHNPRSLALVNNGWVWNADALRDNAGPDSRAYLRREVIVWGDCVKLRYGKCPEDNPFLWDFMAKYTRLMAEHFAGFRIDNCHSTPLPVAEYLLDEARRVRPNLMVFAELFTGSEETDYVFTKRLGLSALIREAMQAWSAGELSRLVHRHGGRPIGSFEIDLPKSDLAEGSEAIKHIRKTAVPALFMACTHDNEAPAQKREARDTLPNAALVSMCASATGSVMGYDEIYPKHVNLVDETRLYTSPFSDNGVSSRTGNAGIGGIIKLLNTLHTMMAVDRYDETHIHHEGEYITVHRVQQSTRKGIFLVAHTAFPGCSGTNGLDPIRLTGTKAKIIGSWKLEIDDDKETKDCVGSDKDHLKGLPSRVLELHGTHLSEHENETIVGLPEDFLPGSILLLETWIPSSKLSEGLDSFICTGAGKAFAELNLVDLNYLLYRCEAEERDSSDGKDGVYNIPNFGSLVYAGLQGWWSVVEDIIRHNDLAHPLCDHLRDGQWALDYVVGRLDRAEKTQGYSRLGGVISWLQQRFDAIRPVPSFLLPRYFAMVIQTAYEAAWKRGLQLFSRNIQHGQRFMHELAMVSVQQTGYVKSASLYPMKQVPSLAAGLPHFSTDWARCWGRDVFISLRGLLLCTGRFDEAREHILAFASVLKHGMIPNLLSGGKLPRYNSRDSVWFFLQAVQDYTQTVPDGIRILEDKVPRRFLPYDDTWFPFDDERAYSQISTISEIIQEVFQRHATGLSFREYNAGPELDMQMTSEGFQIDVNVDWDKGFIFGGNQWNCGTWMDKMGESVKAGNKGYPGTPRDGAAVEITGLLYSALRWVSKLYTGGIYSYDGVKLASDNVVTFAHWADTIQANFERCYYVPLDASFDEQYDVVSGIINRRGIYKDLYRSGKPYEDYQLRPNFTIAMTVAPDLFEPAHALHALSVADSVLRGPTGMATLDPSDLNYRPYYANSEDSNDFATSKGRNYHQGPEWLWPTGFFLRALLKFDLMRREGVEERTETFQQITRRLEGCKRAIRESAWRGLTELTNKDGEFCADSSPTQAWSAGCLLDLYYDASQGRLESK